MYQKVPLQWSLFVFIAVGIIFFVVIVLLLTRKLPTPPVDTSIVAHPSNQSPQIQNTPPADELIIIPKEVTADLPLRLKIPTINVDAAVEYVGLTDDGEMDVPKGPAEVAWFNLGSRPGEIGSAVIAGHYGWRDGIPAVFDTLHKLGVGDTIYVEDEKGVTITFVVRESRKYSPHEEAPEVFISNDGNAHLNLITCGGTWSKSLQSYSDRLVVFTDRVVE